MNLKQKLITSVLVVVLTTIGLSFYVVHQNTSHHFERFLQQKEEELIKLDVQGVGPRPARIVAWKLRQNSPEEQFIRTTKESLLFAGGISILFSLLVGLLLSRFLLNKITLLKNAIEEYRTKRKQLTLPASVKDEIDELAQSYNELVENLEKQDQIRKEFFVDLSHEVRTPITVIRGYMEGLFDGVFQPSEEIYVKVLSELERMNHLVAQMANMAKLESGEVQMELAKVDVGALLRDVLSRFEKELEEKQMTCSIRGRGTCRADGEKFRQIVSNLLNNAVTYGTKATEIVCHIRPRRGVLLTVSNHAPEIKTQDLDKMFRRFVRLDKARTYDSADPHLGVGLSIVKKLVQAHGWHIEAQVDGEFITFSIFES